MSKTLEDVTAESWVAPLFTALMDVCPQVGVWLYSPVLNPVVRAWFIELVDTTPLTVRQAEALFYRYGLTTGNPLGWKVIGKLMGTSDRTARETAARGLVNVWIGLGLRKKPFNEDQREALIAEASKTNSWAALPPNRIVYSLGYAMRENLLKADGYRKQETKPRSRDFLWHPERHGEPHTWREATVEQLYPWR